MFEDAEMQALKRKVWLRFFLVTLSILFVFFAIINGIGLVIGNLFYQEFCVWNTRLDSKRFQALQVTLEDGIKTKGWKNVSINSRLGYTLQGTYLPNPTPSNNTVIFVHGITGSRLMGLWYAPLYIKAGYNVLIYDSRASGESGGNSVSWGFYEKYDLDQWIDWVEQYHPKGKIGVHGVSMGAATALMHAEMNEMSHRVNFYVADSSYSDLEELLTQQIDAAVSLHDPLWIKLLLRYSSIMAKWQSGFRYEDVSPVRSVRHVTTPILYLHGDADVLVPVYMNEQLYTATKGYKEKYISSGDAHAMAIFNHKVEYQRRIMSFIDVALQQ
ncbi:alpha/beta hydrolase [Pelosinus sp. sgz500959]|uniref:alpha/beta hydrolase n=1 Tax=Pelosinus sp. sgz500959 TaxID=3242472 RepID=UPI0036709142